MTATTRTFATVDELASEVARLIAGGIEAAAGESRPYLLGCPGGRTPRPVYQALGRRAAETGLDCSGLVVVMMDDYLDPASAAPALVAGDAHYSCRRFAEHEIRRVVNHGLAPDHEIPADHVWLPQPADPGAYDRRIVEAGGIDLFMVASGASDGHVAFCGPGAPLDGETSVVELAAGTRADNMITFPQFRHVADVPTHGVSVGLGTIRHRSREVLLLLHGADKRQSARRVATGRYRPDWPATFIHECADASIWLDAEAAPTGAAS